MAGHLIDRYGDALIVIGVSYDFWRFHPTPWVWLGGILAVSGFLLAIGAVSHLGIGRLFWQVYQSRQTATR